MKKSSGNIQLVVCGKDRGIWRRDRSLGVAGMYVIREDIGASVITQGEQKEEHHSTDNLAEEIAIQKT